MLSVIIPARNEIHLERTIRDILQNARGEIEILVVLDGWLPEPQIHIGDERVKFFHFPESIGQRQGINYAARQAKGDFMMKLDAHCAVDEGFDVKLAADCPYEWTVIPRMYNLDVNTWKPKLHKRTDYMYIGLREDGQLRAEYYGGDLYRKLHRNPAEIDDTMCCMGPGFFMHMKRFLDLGGCDESHGSWGSQGIEVACKAWLSGGALKVNKKTWFAHWFRGGSGPGFPYHLSGRAVEHARNYSKDLWLNDKWPLATRKFQWLLDKFDPPNWGTGKDPDEEKKKRRKQEIKAEGKPMELKNIERQIRHLFDVLVRNDFSPIGSHQGTRETLADLINFADYRVGAEIGVWRGYFSGLILEKCPKFHMNCVDPWIEYSESKWDQAGQDRNFNRAMERLTPFIEQGRCTIHRDFSMNVVDKFTDGSLDFVNIDGAHVFDHAMMDIIKWVPKVRIGGLVAIHDYFPMRRGGVIEAVDAYTRCHMIHPWYVIREAVPTAFWVRQPEL